MAEGYSPRQCESLGQVKELCMSATRKAIQDGVEIPLSEYEFNKQMIENTLKDISDYAHVLDQLTAEELRRGMVELGPDVGSQHLYKRPVKFIVRDPTMYQTEENFYQALEYAERSPEREPRTRPRLTPPRAASPSSQQEAEGLAKQEAERLEKQEVESLKKQEAERRSAANAAKAAKLAEQKARDYSTGRVL